MKFIIFLILLSLNSVQAEIYKTAITTDSGIEFYWWPVLPNVPRWHHDREHSLHCRINAQAPDNNTFSNAETEIYARALYKPRIPDTKSLSQLIVNDKNNFLNKNSSIIISGSEGLIDGDGNTLQSFTFFPKNEGTWEKVSYSEEADFYLLFTISSRSKSGLESILPMYNEYTRKYKESPE